MYSVDRLDVALELEQWAAMTGRPVRPFFRFLVQHTPYPHCCLLEALFLCKCHCSPRPPNNVLPESARPTDQEIPRSIRSGNNLRSSADLSLSPDSIKGTLARWMVSESVNAVPVRYCDTIFDDKLINSQ